MLRGLQRLRDLLCDRQSLIDGNRPPRDPLRQVFPFDKLHHQRRQAARLLESVDLGNVRVIECSKHARFALESRKTVGIVRQLLRQDLQSDISTELRIPRSIHFPHAARPQRRHDLVRAEG